MPQIRVAVGMTADLVTARGELVAARRVDQRATWLDAPR